MFGVNLWVFEKEWNMRKIVDVFKRKDHSLVWTYVISLDRQRLNSGIVEFEREALRLAEDQHGDKEYLTAKVRLA